MLDVAALGRLTLNLMHFTASFHNSDMRTKRFSENDKQNVNRFTYWIFGVYGGVFGRRRAVGEHLFVQCVQVVVWVDAVKAVSVQRF